MHRRKRRGRQGYIIQCGPVYASSPTGVRALDSVYIHTLSFFFFRNSNDFINPDLEIVSQL